MSKQQLIEQIRQMNRSATENLPFATLKRRSPIDHPVLSF